MHFEKVKKKPGGQRDKQTEMCVDNTVCEGVYVTIAGN